MAPKMESENNADEDYAAYYRENPKAPVRILVSTATHLVLGTEYHEKISFMSDLICRHFWNCGFNSGLNRLSSYNDLFGYDNLACYFLFDHGLAPDNNDDAVPILWYRWTGESFVLIREALPPIIERRLKKYPFTLPTPWPEPQPEPRQTSPTQKRQKIWLDLRRAMTPSDEDFKFLKENPKHAMWLERNMEPRFCTKLKSLEAEWEESRDNSSVGAAMPFIQEQTEEEKREEPGDCTDT
ncbi:hypothetical protein F4804DRAFT_299893 [Jackrogersella minutella]|nr:hypothetical protein F4804DRAFT_299893 [Jackrogersella minutella]